jgi:hypothetical protein
MAAIGNLVVNLSLQSAAFIRDLGKSSQAVAKNTSAMQRSVSNLSTAFAGLFTAKLIRQVTALTTESLKLAASMHGPLADAAQKNILQFETLQDTFKLGIAKGFLDGLTGGLATTEESMKTAAKAGELFGGALAAAAETAQFIFGTVVPDLANLADKTIQAALDKLDRLRGQMQDLSFAGMQTQLGITPEDTEAALAYGTATELAAMAQQSFWSAQVETTVHGEELLRTLEAQKDIMTDLRTPGEEYAATLERIAAANLSGVDAARAHSAATAVLVNDYLQLADNIGTALGILFKDSKAVAVAQAVINTAQAITKTFATYGATPWGFALAASMAAVGAAQIATIMSAQKGSGKKPAVTSGRGSSGGGGTAGGSAVAATTPAAGPRQAVTINLMGQGGFSREQVRDLARELNGLVADGATISTS